MNNIVVLASEVKKEFPTQAFSGPCAERAKAIAPKRAKNTPVINHLRDLIWNGNYGLNKIWLDTKNSCNFNLSRGWFKTIPAWRFEDHFAGKDLLYACGNPWDTRYALGMIDIDAVGHLAAKKARDAGLPQPPTPPGAADGAVEAARAVDALFKEHHLVSSCTIFWERSSNGVGMSGYILFGGPQKREAYQLLQAFLKHRLQPLVDGGKIEGIEVKGKPPEMEDVIIQGHVVHQRCVTLGTLCKLPSTATLEDLKRLPKLRLDDLKGLPAPEAKPQPPKVVVQQPITHHDPAELVFGSGSVSPCSFTYGMLKDLHTHRQQAQVLLKRHEKRLVAKIGRKLIIEEDIAIFIMILKFFKLDAKEDGAMPVRRIYNFWRSLYLAGHLDRSAAYERITAMRDWFSGLGLIDWQDHTYEPPKFHEKKAIRTEMEGIAGVVLEIVKEKGRCCRWSVSQHFVGWLNLSVIHPPSLITTGITPIRPKAIYRLKLIGTRDDRGDQWRLMDDDGCQEWQSRRAA